MDRAQLADFLRSRREALQPEDVGLPRGARRRTGGQCCTGIAVIICMRQPAPRRNQASLSPSSANAGSPFRCT